MYNALFVADQKIWQHCTKNWLSATLCMINRLQHDPDHY